MKNSYFMIIFFILLSGCLFNSSLHFSEKDSLNKKNLILNPGFELGKYDKNIIPAGWVILDKNQENKVIWDDSSVLEGSYSLHAFPTKSKLNIISDSFDINNNGTYYIKSKIKSDKSSNVNVTLNFIVFGRDSKKNHIFKKQMKLSDNWQNLELSAGFFKNDSQYGRIIISLPENSGCNIWIDDTGCYEIYQLKK